MPLCISKMGHMPEMVKKYSTKGAIVQQNMFDGKTKSAVIHNPTLQANFRYAEHWNSAETEGNMLS